MYKLENNVAWTADLKNAFKRNVTRAKVLYDNIELNENNYLQDLTIEEQRYIKDYGFVGTATAKKLELNVLDINGELNLENKELVVKIGADYEGNTYYINYGNFIVDSAPEHDETNGKTRVIAYDYMIKFNKPYVDRVVYPCTLLTLLQDVCSQAGVTLGNTDFANASFSVENNQFEGYTLRQVLQNIAKCAFSWARIGQDNKLYLDFSLTPEITEPITINEYKLNSFKKAIEYYGPVNQVTYADSDIEGQEEKVPSTPPVGDLKELVIYDNLFAYTAEKRHELIQAGTMLLGLEYMPISQLELVGFAYLDCKDAIEVDTLDEETFSSKVFSHKIKYNGTLHDSIITEGTSGNEEVYKNTATNMFQNQQTQIKVDKANKNIKLLTQEVDEQNDKIAQLEITTEGIEAEVSNIYKTTKTVSGNRQIVLENCVKGYLLKLRIKGNNDVFSRLYPADDLYPSDTLYPRGDSRIVVTDGNGNSMVYDLRVSEVLRANDEVYDEYILEDNFAKVIRRVNPDGTTKILETEEIIGTYTIYVAEGTNTIRIKNYSAPIETVYVEQNAYTDQFATKIEMNTKIEETENVINLEVSKKIDDEDLTGANIMLRINNDESEALINADKIDIDGKAVHFKTNINETKGPYTSADTDRIKDIIQGTVAPTEEDYEKYDLNENREIDASDWMNIQKAILQNEGYINGTGTFEINPYTMRKSVALWDDKSNDYSAILSLYGNYFNQLTTKNFNVTNPNREERVSIGAYDVTLQSENGSISSFLNTEINNIPCHLIDVHYVNSSQNVYATILIGALSDNSSSIQLFGHNGSATTITDTGITTPTVTQTSKESAKKNIELYNENALDIVKQSEIYEYNFKFENDDDKKHIGFVIGDEGGDYKTPNEVMSKDEEGIEQYNMTSILWKAVQEQQEIIEQMQKKIKELKEGK